MKLQSNVSEIVIRHITDEDGTVIIENAVIQRSINEVLIGYNGQLGQVQSKVLKERMLTLVNGNYKIPIKYLEIMDKGNLYYVWLVRRLPWAGTIHHVANKALFYMSSKSGKGTHVQAFLQNGAEGGFAYIQHADNAELTLAKVNMGDSDDLPWKLTHPAVSNCSSTGNACIGSEAIRTRVVTASDRTHQQVLQDLFLGASNSDWTGEEVALNNFFVINEQTGELDHIYTPNHPNQGMRCQLILPAQVEIPNAPRRIDPNLKADPFSIEKGKAAAKAKEPTPAQAQPEQEPLVIDLGDPPPAPQPPRPPRDLDDMLDEDRGDDRDRDEDDD